MPTCTSHFYLGEEETAFTVPDGVESIQIDLFGGCGDVLGGGGGEGGRVEASIPVEPGDVVTVKVGGVSTGGNPQGLGSYPDGGDGGVGAERTSPSGPNQPTFPGVFDSTRGGAGGTYCLVNGVDVAIAGGASLAYDGGDPDAPPRSSTLDGDGATQTIVGAGGDAPNSSVIAQGLDGNPGAANQGGAGADGVAETMHLDDNIVGSLAPAFVDETGHITSGSEPHDIIPVTVPAGCYLVVHANIPSPPVGSQAYIRGWTEDTYPFGTELCLSFEDSGGGFGGYGRWDNESGLDQDVFLEIHTAFGPGGDIDYDMDYWVVRRRIVAGNGGGGGYKGGGGAASQVKPPSSIPQADGGGGSSWVMDDGFDIVYSTFQTFDGNGFAFICYDFAPPGIGPLHIPHKNWATQSEAENYHQMERWARGGAVGDLHFPHKLWLSQEEAANYLTIERWARNPTTLLHIPHKNHATPFERENYLSIERWARDNF